MVSFPLSVSQVMSIKVLRQSSTYTYLLKKRDIFITWNIAIHSSFSSKLSASVVAQLVITQLKASLGKIFWKNRMQLLWKRSEVSSYNNEQLQLNELFRVVRFISI